MDGRFRVVSFRSNFLIPISSHGLSGCYGDVKSSSKNFGGSTKDYFSIKRIMNVEDVNTRKRHLESINSSTEDPDDSVQPKKVIRTHLATSPGDIIQVLPTPLSF